MQQSSQEKVEGVLCLVLKKRKYWLKVKLIYKLMYGYFKTDLSTLYFHLLLLETFDISCVG